MGYYITIMETNLKAPRDISAEMKGVEFYVPWTCGEDGGVDIDGDRWMKDDDAIIEDLRTLQKVGVRGALEINGEQGEWTKIVLDDLGVKTFEGSIVYPEKPTRTWEVKDG